MTRGAFRRGAGRQSHCVVAGFGPAIQDFGCISAQVVDGRDKPHGYQAKAERGARAFSPVVMTRLVVRAMTMREQRPAKLFSRGPLS
jgi:hypothetical protein